MQLRARELRRAMTPAEKKLWQRIRYGQVGVHFRRQHAVGPYIVDFYCASARLVIEIDGDSHGDLKQAEYDAKRSVWLNEQKQYRIIWFWNSEIIHDIDQVIMRITEALGNPRAPAGGKNEDTLHLLNRIL